MPDSLTDKDARRLYDQALDASYGQAARHIPWDAAFELAHEVASALVKRAHTGDTFAEIRSVEAWVSRATRSRLRDYWRNGRRRAAAEAVHVEERADAASSWAQPGLELEVRELALVVDETLATMPKAMHDVFTAIRRDGLSYRDAAARLDIGVGSVHTQLSRANARLRDAIARYRSAASDNAVADLQPPLSANGLP
jgi:RNA polymerase sigma factor (sigma-70 family)